MEPVYLDHNASSPIRPEAAEAVARALAIGANPSSVHARGRTARSLIETARGTVARFVGGDPQALVFTSGGAEANALAIESAIAAGFAPLIIGAVEHETVIETAHASGAEVLPLPVDKSGRADIAWLRDTVARLDARRPFVALMLANNENGVIQPIAEAAQIVRAANGWLHVDAVQAAGKIAIDMNMLGADSMTLSAHKLGGPQGVGALVWGPRATLTRRLHGGGQERGRRAGTENLAGIAGFAASVDASVHKPPVSVDMTRARDAAAARVQAAGATVIGEGAPRLDNTLCMAVADWPSELQVIALDLDGVMVSAGAACSSGKVKASRILEAMGHRDLAPGALRASSGWNSQPADWERFADVWTSAYARFTARKASAA
ncbi:MAG TPA: cysteine desulfurase family protein [Caulobacteraceae bacterium]|jgi:cysteine desulfurase|nr:cysteine desulfurase family protein [Caulobacteraceae bacterium]